MKLRVDVALICTLCLLSACGGGGSSSDSKSSPKLPPQSLAITSAGLPNGTTGSPYGGNSSGMSLTASGGVAPYQWSWAAATGSALPPGLSLVNGSVSGTPTTTGSYNVIVTVTDSASPPAHASANYVITVTGGALAITSGNPPSGTVGKAYDARCNEIPPCNVILFGFSLTASGGVQPYVWSWAPAAGSSLPPGLSLSNGSISGIPKTAGSYGVVVTVADSSSPAQQKSANYSIVISASQTSPLTITSGTPPNGTVGKVYGYFLGCRGVGAPVCIYGFPLQATGGVAPYTWSGSLPPGLSFQTFFRALISGTPVRAGTYQAIVSVTDSESPPAQVSANYTIVIAPPPPPVINTMPPPSSGALNLPYSFTFTANGYAPLTWSETGTLIPGLHFGADGTLSGTPTATGSFPITVGVQDSAGQNATPQAFTIQVFLHGFKATGSMATTRTAHTATLLSNGKVLIAGGSDANGNPLATSELFDPATGSFTGVGSMQTARFQQSATLLTNGKVLVAGGGTASTELFDPATETFFSTGSMEASRSYQTATLLPNGKVLVAGGSDTNGNPLLTAEVFDPATGTFAATGDMITARYGHTATLLTDGRVLVTGGLGVSGNSLDTAELFDPVNGKFTATGSMVTAQYAHTATLLRDGRVLLAGGFDASGHTQSAGQLFDPATGTFSTMGSMGIGRAFQTATLLADGTVLITGGVFGPPTQALALAELFDPSSGTFRPTGSMTAARAQHTATLLGNDKVLVTGGGVKTAELYQ